jgi:uncharacterized lipoprotein YddW (UPF0748 family)
MLATLAVSACVGFARSRYEQDRAAPRPQPVHEQAASERAAGQSNERPQPAHQQPQEADAPRDAAPPPLRREFRAAWVATVNNIDWPSRPGLPTATARAELDAIVDRAAELGLNALIFQVRPAGDAFYASRLEPWSEWLTGEQGTAPNPPWDPLAHVIERCHAAGIQLHAWCNPYRAWHPKAKSARPAPEHVLSALPSACVRYGSYRWMDPADPQAAAWSLRVLRDIVDRYDVDGLHIDDYFHPYAENGAAGPDRDRYVAYRRSGGRLSQSDRRRSHIDDFVERLCATVHRTKPWVQFGISPFGIARPGVPRGIEAGVDQYEHLGADVVKWLREGWVDYLAPQLYWPIDQKPQSFAVLLPWWLEQNVRQRHVWPGLDANRVLERRPPVRNDELVQQVDLIRAAARVPGYVIYSFSALRDNSRQVGGAVRDRLHREPALVPASPWLGAEAPQRPSGAVGEGLVSWNAGSDARFVAVQVRGPNGWRTLTIGGARAGRCALPSDAVAIALTAISRTGATSEPAVHAVR